VPSSTSAIVACSHVVPLLGHQKSSQGSADNDKHKASNVQGQANLAMSTKFLIKQFQTANDRAVSDHIINIYPTFANCDPQIPAGASAGVGCLSLSLIACA
jgi:hypothetical protein